MNEDEQINIVCTSGFGHRTRQPYVQMLCQAKDFITQMSPADARNLAMNLLQCAEAADGDAFLMTFAMERAGLDEKRAVQIMFDFREWRRKRDLDILPWDGEKP